MKEFLSHNGHSFTVRGVDDDEAAYDDLLALGYRTVPVTVVGASVVVGFDPAALAQALGKHAKTTET